MLLGIAVGFIAPEFATSLKPIGEAFVALIKMMISPVIFCTIVLGVGSVRSAAHVGKVGGLALGYFLVMSTIALTNVEGGSRIRAWKCTMPRNLPVGVSSGGRHT